MKKITVVLLILFCFSCKKTTKVDTTPPTVTITYPENNATVIDTVTIIADATDNKGVTKVEFYINDSLNYTDTSSPWEYLWDTNPLPDIFCTITAKAYDAEGNIGTSQGISVNLSAPQIIPPLGLYSITKDKNVLLFWYTSNYEGDFNGYIVYYYEGDYGNSSPLRRVPHCFEVADSLSSTHPSTGLDSLEIGGLTNGITYSFLVVAACDNWSELSRTSNIITDTPRPETIGVKVYAYQIDKTQAGFELSDFTIIDLTNLNTSDYTTPTEKGDIMCERFEVIPGAGFRPWIDGINGGGVQNMGYMSDWSELDEAPTDGYSASGHSVVAMMGHVYTIKTGDNHYAKIQITDVAEDETWIEFKAAYQPDAGNTEF